MSANLRPPWTLPDPRVVGDTEAHGGCLREAWPEVELELRVDAGFAVPILCDYCEAEAIDYTIGLITNARLQVVTGSWRLREGSRS